MPFRTLASLKKVANLGAEVVSIAPLEAAGIVAVLTNDPVQLGVYPMTSGTSKLQSVSIERGDAVALVNKMVAVVKSGDEVWALLDIQHKPKIDSIGRHIKGLYANPNGDPALAIAWDGHGAALSVQSNEVGGRQFTLRGEVRVASIAKSATYVIVDGQGGGQLREHPGATPESAASARADLPAEAKSFDLLAGGSELSAASKRGAESVCVVRRQGQGSLVAKMIGVPGSVAGVAVNATSLFVAGQDGRLRLFDGDTLHRAGEGIAQPTFELDLRGDGPPMAIAASTKGGNKIWVGTRGGDLLVCDAAKGTLDI
jgi:hypothetical protein